MNPGLHGPRPGNPASPALCLRFACLKSFNLLLVIRGDFSDDGKAWPRGPEHRGLGEGASYRPGRQAKERGIRVATQKQSERDPLIGALLSERYRVLERIAQGGMGVVYRARHVVLESDVAVKVLRQAA